MAIVKLYFHCPKCGNHRRFGNSAERPSSPSKKRAGQKQEAYDFGEDEQDGTGLVRCGRCHHLFRPAPMPRSPLMNLMRWTTGAALFFSVGVSLLVITGGMTALAKGQWVQILGGVLAAHPSESAGLAMLGTGFAILMGMVSWIMAILDNLRFRREMSDPTAPPPRIRPAHTSGLTRHGIRHQKPSPPFGQRGPWRREQP